ncbi:uncharacterized protein KZ484_018579 [Pholidichthys leucotaenia]
MSSFRRLGGFIRERLTAAVEEILTEFEKTIVQYEDEIESRRIITRIPIIKLHRADVPHQPDYKEEEEEDVLADRQLWNQEEPKLLQVKEEQEELCISQQGELLMVKVETEVNGHSEVKPNTEQLLRHNSAVAEVKDEEGRQLVDSGATKEEPEPKKRRLKTGSDSNGDDDSLMSVSHCEDETDAPHLQLCNQARNSILDQEEQDATQIKEQEMPGLKQETDSVMVPNTSENNGHNETEPTSDYYLCHSAPKTGRQIQGARKKLNPGSVKQKIVYSSPDMKIRPKDRPFACKICLKTFVTGLHFSNHMKFHTAGKPFSCKMCGFCCRDLSGWNEHMKCHIEKRYSCENCGKYFKHPSHLSRHMATHTSDKA